MMKYVGAFFMSWAVLSIIGCVESLHSDNESENDTTRDSSSETGASDTADSDTADDSAPDTDTASSTDSIGDAGPDVDYDAEFEARAAELVAQMTLEEKVSQMGHIAPAIRRLDIPGYNWWNEALHGVARSGVATVFPQSISMAATFDPDLLFEEATAISTEARVMSNFNGKGLTYWSPTINLARDPRWGRNEETYGEDPYLTSRMAVAFVKGMQGDDPKYLKTVSTIKHFAANNIEATRHTGSSDMDERNLREFYFPAFKAGIEEARAQSVMCSYNEVNGIPSCANSWMLKDVLRGEWGFKGYVVSDCWAIQDIVDGHAYVSSNVDASLAALSAGTNLECGDRYQADLVYAVQQGLVNEEEIDKALTRSFFARFKLGEFDPAEQVPYRAIPASELDGAAHKELALKTARESMVLLKNDGLLPLDRGAISSIAVIGPNAARVVFGGYSGEASAPIPPLDGIVAAVDGLGIVVNYAEGAGISMPSTASSIEQASELAASADVAIVVGGTDQSVSDEGLDRTDIALPGVQESLIQAVREANPNTVLVLVSGGPLSIEWETDNINAILNAGYAGQAQGQAIAEVLFGDVNPAGRLPQTYYKSVADLPPMENYDIIQGGRTYMYFEGEVLYPFGHGLSYTRFEYTNLMLPASVPAAAAVSVSFDVENIGDVEGDEVAQLYVHDVEASVPVALKQLKRFKRISLAPGEKKSVEFTIPASELSFFDMDKEQFVTEPGVFEIMVGASSADIRMVDTVRIE